MENPLDTNAVTAKPKRKSRMPELKRQFDDGNPERVAELRQLAAAALRNPEEIKAFKASVHKISGTAGTFGYGPVTDMCKAMEGEIVARLEAGTANDSGWLASLPGFIDRVQEGFKHSTMSFEGDELVITPVSATVAIPQLFVVDGDIKFLELLERVKAGVNLNVIVESDPKRALERIRSSDIAPQGLLVAQSFKGSPVSGLDLIKAQAEKNPHAVMGLLLENDSIEARFEAMKMGASHIFCKPISGNALIKSMEEALAVQPASTIKVLIVDDDTIFCDYVADVLSESGIQSMAIQDPIDLFSKLQEFKPDILLLDLMLPKYDGFNLLKTLRQDVNYKNLAIVIVTGSEALDTRINAYSANVDDILFKPIDKNILQKRILNIANRRSSSQSSSENYLGLLHIQELTAEINSQLKKPAGAESYLALFEVQNYAEWSSEKGDQAVRELMIFISNQLQWETDQTMRCFWYKKSVFAIVFEGVEYSLIEKKLFNFLMHLIQLQPKAHLAFDCGIVPISKEFENASKVLNACEECLLEASRKESTPVRLVHKVAEKAKKEIVIVDPNPDLLNILKTAFEMHGLVVSTYTEGGEALSKIAACSESRLPSLILIERKLVDMDGMDLYLKLKSRFRTPIPCFMLTVFSSDKDISDGIRNGVMEYIVKPFNISILVQKVLQAIYKN